ncbi:type II toxin-antitoxin system mRNA interferase toxin, RelE/StbE family [Candidatus Kaiserbacteria bacterium]|nr:type II toxin-antitoxin system mRNA interferase toxin, RelE/StbE family [Candidatus Kaiserbacteria bacterium]
MQFVFSRLYKRQFKKLPLDLQVKVMIRLDLFMQDETHPLLDNHQLRFEWQGYRSMNITGDYRVIFKKESDDMVRLEQVGTHHELYGS